MTVRAHPATVPIVGGWLPCRVVRSFAFDIESAGSDWIAPLARHLDTCLPCQAEVARARSALRELRCLRSDVEQAPPGLAAIPFSELPADGAKPRAVHTLATVASAAAAAGVVLLIGRRLRSPSS